MKHVKVFSKFNEDHSRPEFRKPNKVRYEDFCKKLVNFGKADFTKFEKEFFNKFYKENINSGTITQKFLETNNLLLVLVITQAKLKLLN